MGTEDVRCREAVPVCLQSLCTELGEVDKAQADFPARRFRTEGHYAPLGIKPWHGEWESAGGAEDGQRFSLGSHYQATKDTS